jgi:hypothetical protein
MEYKLFFFLIGCRLPNRYTEQHDVFFGIGQTAADLIPALQSFWTEAQGLHIDCWREVTNVNGFKIEVLPKNDMKPNQSELSLFFINLGGYKKDEFEEFHFKQLFAASNEAEAIKLAKKTPFYLQFGFKGAVSHIDNKYGVDVDEIFPVEEILTPFDKNNYSILVTNEIANQPDEIHLGYTTFSKLKASSDSKS